MRTAAQMERFRQMVADYDAVTKDGDPAVYSNPWKALYYARLEQARLAEIERQTAARNAQAAKAVRDSMQRVIDEQYQEREAVSRRSGGRAPSVADHRIVNLEGGRYQRRGGVIATNGDFSNGYTIRGDSLVDRSGSVTHKRSGTMWMPVRSGHPQISDP
ncbi:MAG: hypothetical protein H7A50_08290 [Akkermansiaceae bacterium]|nr:hypothetical protein [Akkermansiaceae bacterium]